MTRVEVLIGAVDVKLAVLSSKVLMMRGPSFSLPLDELLRRVQSRHRGKLSLLP